MTGRPEPDLSAVVVTVPAAERVVARHRLRFDPAASWGVPAHVTVLYPFVHPSSIDADVVRRLGAAVAAVPVFDCTFSRCGWFDDDVLWLAPEPAAPFAELTTAVWEAFPDHPPYAGAHPDVVPHLTVGQRPEASLEELVAVEAQVAPLLPVTTTAARVHLLAGSTAPGSWRVLRECPLGPAR